MAEYPNRTDLRNPAAKMAKTAVPGQAYGEAGKQLAAQNVVPMGGSPTTATPQSAPPRVQPGGMGDFLRPTERPGEPITAGADFGAGMNMQQAGIPIIAPGFNDALEEIKVLYRQFPNDDLALLLSSMLNEGA